MIVETSITATVRVEMAVSTIDSVRVNVFLTSAEYLMVATDAPVIGKV